ncbi:MAG TPA: glycosyltransferase family 4 protein [Candidatus Rubrimentiphilum sp.]|nr:glycosyltransferase family 4 protein [Candidatus Rubrimentiphilum sp.]
MRIALVVPRASEEITGGAEAFCLTAARELAANHDVEVLTTCAHDYQTWANVYAEGVDAIDGLTVRRFRVDQPRDTLRFNQISAQFRYRLSTLSDREQELWLREQGPYSTTMLRYLWEQRENYDAFVFFTYLYATTYFGLPLVQDRAYLVPLTHDEWPVYMPAWNALFDRPRGMLFVSPEERGFVQRRFSRTLPKSPICYVPLHAAQKGDAEAFRRSSGISEPFLLYVGRIDGSKGCDELCALFAEYSQSHGQSGLHLVLAGEGGELLPRYERIHALGYVDEATKWNALAACSAFVMPSRNESLCIALLEAWAAQKPALVNGASPVLVGQCRRANGGLWYSDQKTFNAAVDVITSEVGEILGRQGSRFFREHYERGNVRESFSSLLSS